MNIRSLSSYYLCFSLLGGALIISTGMLRIPDRVPVLRKSVFAVLTLVFLTSFVAARQIGETCRPLLEMERIVRSTVVPCKKTFPDLPDESLIYIQGGDLALRWAVSGDKSFKLFYNDSISVYYEGIVRKGNLLPPRCSGIYVFDYRDQGLHFDQFIEGSMLEDFLKERAARS